MTRPQLWSLAIPLILLAGCASGTRSMSGVVADGSPEAAVAGMPTPRLAEGERVVRVVWMAPGQHPGDGAAMHRPVAPATTSVAAPAPVPAQAPTIREGERIIRVIRLPAGQRPTAVPPASPTTSPSVQPSRTAPSSPASTRPQARVIRRPACEPRRPVICPPNLKSIFCPPPAGGCDDLCPGGRCGVPR